MTARANRIFELDGRRSPRDGRLAPAAKRHAGARARSECDRPLRRGHRRWPRSSCLAAGGKAARGAQSAPGGGRFPRRLLTGRAARARYSARTRERRGVRANWPPLTRPTVRGLAVVCSSPHAAGWRKLPCGAPFGHEPETAIDHGVLGGRERIRCAVGRLCDAP